MISRREAVALTATLAAAAPLGAQLPAGLRGRLQRDTLISGHVPGSIAVSMYTPPVTRETRLPLMLLLHGGNGSDQDLLRFLPAIDQEIVDGRLPPMAIAMPSARRSLYMDYKDGSQRWETFVLADLLPYLRKAMPVSAERAGTFIGGLSMGGLGCLRIAFKHPDQFAAVAALEPAIEPALSWSDVGPRTKFWRPENVIAPMFGSPIDLDYWAANNPAVIAKRDPRRLVDLPIYLDVGDQDMLYLNQGTEFLHRILFDAGVGHEYRLVRGADHVGPSLIPRMIDALGFIGRQIAPPQWINDDVRKARGAFDLAKRAQGMAAEPIDPRRIHGM